jgi:hypothetical protein
VANLTLVGIGDRVVGSIWRRKMVCPVEGGEVTNFGTVHAATVSYDKRHGGNVLVKTIMNQYGNETTLATHRGSVERCGLPFGALGQTSSAL